MRKSYEAPITEIIDLDSLSFLSASGEIGDAVAADLFSSSYGRQKF